MQLTAQATENEGLQEQVQLQHKKYLEASQKYQALQDV
uniref:Uncharacterized protein n=1 Tax=Anguilla anguilla TaxID=7936 RepID=A0A0E9T8E5_ANGAN